MRYKKNETNYTMRIKKYIWAFYFVILSVSTLNAQVVLDEWDDIMTKLRINDQLDPSNRNLYTQIEGNPYLNDGELQDGIITIKDQGTYKGKFRYNVYANEVEFESKGKYFAIADPEIIDNIKIGKITLVHAMIDVKKGWGSYFELVSDGNCRLLARKNIDLVEAEPRKAYLEPKPAYFDPKDDTYFIVKEFRIAYKANKKNIREIMSDHSEEIEQYIKKEKLSYSSREDMVKLITFYNSL